MSSSEQPQSSENGSESEFADDDREGDINLSLCEDVDIEQDAEDNEGLGEYAECFKIENPDSFKTPDTSPGRDAVAPGSVKAKKDLFESVDFGKTRARNPVLYPPYQKPPPRRKIGKRKKMSKWRIPCGKP